MMLLQENRFSKCDVCCHLKEELRAKKCPAEKVLLKERRRDHIKFVRYILSFFSNSSDFLRAEPHLVKTIYIYISSQRKLAR